MTIWLPEDLERFVQAKVQSGRFASEEDVVAEALRRLQREEETSVPNTQSQTPSPITAWQRLLTIMQNVPDEVFDRMPSDSSEQLDHYIYGTPKRPTA
jgi:putative addiction module CopG family antidote